MADKLFDFIAETEPILNDIIKDPPKTKGEIKQYVMKLEALITKYGGEITMPVMKHCLHTLEHSFTLGVGREVKQCCNCGKVFVVSSYYINEPESGHGSFHTVKRIAYHNYIGQDEDCPGTKEK